jgi:hypothetical protein
MTIQEALTKVRAGGYQYEFKYHDPGRRAGVLGLHAFSTLHVEDFCLDPEFWRALGRMLGWQHERVWRNHRQRFIDHLAQGKTPELFFATL